MEFPSFLTQATLLKRYKRFLAEVVLNDQEHRIIYCPNIGAMTGCDVLGSRIWFSHAAEPRRRLQDTWELVEVSGGNLVYINPHSANQLILEAIAKGALQELKGYTLVEETPLLLEESSFDLLLEREKESKAPDEQCFVVTKIVTLGDEIHRGFFPDAPTYVGVQQLESLIHAKQLGYRAVLIYCVCHSGIERVFPADHIDSEYGSLLRQAMMLGVEIIGYKADVTLKQISLKKAVEVCIPVRMISSFRSEKSK